MNPNSIWDFMLELDKKEGANNTEEVLKAKKALVDAFEIAYSVLFENDYGTCEMNTTSALGDYRVKIDIEKIDDEN